MMETVHDFELDFDAQTYLAFHGGRLARLLDNPGLRARFEEVMAEAPGLCRPAACYEPFAISQFMHEYVRLANGTRIGGGPFVSVIGGASELILAVCTIGPELDARVRAYASARERFQMMVLDELGSWAVDQVRLQLYEKLHADYDRRGWRTSTCLSPGESAWQVQEQRIIFQLLDAAQVGVSLNNGLVMEPFKSLSLALGVGPGPLGVEGASNCDFCSMKERCRYRAHRAS